MTDRPLTVRSDDPAFEWSEYFGKGMKYDLTKKRTPKVSIHYVNGEYVERIIDGTEC